MHTAILGTDFRNVSLDILEKIVLDEEKIKSFVTELPKTAPISECVVLSTCNRMEIYYTCEDYELAKSWLLTYLAKKSNISASFLDTICFHHRCNAAVNHLYQVAAGMQSMVFGENEILSQIKMAYALSSAQDATGAYLNKLFQSAIAAGKKVREKTDISKGAFSISSIAVDAMKEVLKDQFLETPILIIGAGTMANRALKKLSAIGHTQITIVNRTLKSASELAEEYGYEALPISKLSKILPNFRAIYIATASKFSIITAQDTEEIQESTLIVDVSVPRNVDPRVEDNPRVRLTSIDGLKEIAGKTRMMRLGETDKMKAIINAEIEAYTKWYHVKESAKKPAKIIKIPHAA